MRWRFGIRWGGWIDVDESRGMLACMSSVSRRQVLRSVAMLPVLGTVGMAMGSAAAVGQAPAPAAAAPTGPHRLDPLPYAYDALEPYIDARTMEIHHGRHHAAYVMSLNRALANQPDWATKSAVELISDLAAVPEGIRGAVRNHGGGHVNHTFFWQLLKRNGGTTPTGALMESLVRRFGTYDGFKAEFTRASLSVFGSGWAWLSADKTGEIGIETTANQDSPYMGGRVPLLGIDVWEHAYYLKYQNRRADYVAAFFEVVNWEFVSARMTKVR